MFKLIRSTILFAFILIVFQACSKGLNEWNLASNIRKKLDKIYGACNNPNRQLLNAKEKMLCEDKAKSRRSRWRSR